MGVTTTGAVLKGPALGKLWIPCFSECMISQNVHGLKVPSRISSPQSILESLEMIWFNQQWCPNVLKSSILPSFQEGTICENHEKHLGNPEGECFLELCCANAVKTWHCETLETVCKLETSLLMYWHPFLWEPPASHFYSRDVADNVFILKEPLTGKLWCSKSSLVQRASLPLLSVGKKGDL